MYLSNGWHGAARGMELKTREAKIGEIWRQLTWLEAQVSAVHAAEGGTNLLGPLLTFFCDTIVTILVRARDDWAPALARGLVAVTRGVGLFFTSLVPRAPSRARRRAE